MRKPVRLLSGLVIAFLISGVIEWGISNLGNVMAAPVAQNRVVDIRLVPAITTVRQGETFTVDI